MIETQNGIFLMVLFYISYPLIKEVRMNITYIFKNLKFMTGWLHG